MIDIEITKIQINIKERMNNLGGFQMLDEEEEKIDRKSSDGFEWIDMEKEEGSKSKKYQTSSAIVLKNDEESDFMEASSKEENEDEFMSGINQSLSSQVNQELNPDLKQEEIDETLNPNEAINPNETSSKKPKKPVWKKMLIAVGIVFGVILLSAAFLLGTTPGRNLMIDLAAKYIHKQLNNAPEDITSIPTPIVEQPEKNETIVAVISPTPTPIPRGLPRQEDYVMTCLLFGIEEIKGARNTDSMMLASVNTKDKTIKLASIMRDTYIEVPGHRPNKLNAVYAMESDRDEGAKLLVETIEQLYHIKIDAYASVNFNAMEQIVDLLGGVTIELTARERDYLNTTNYISNPANRRVKAGVQTLNGNQVVGYCRVRKVPTLGGENNDYGRTMRQRRVLNAIFDKYKSKGISDLISIANTCLGYVTTNISETQIADALKMIINNGITDLDSANFPVEGTYHDSGTTPYNGLTYTLVLDQEANTKELYKFIFGDTQEEAEENYLLHAKKEDTSDTDNSNTDTLNTNNSNNEEEMSTNLSPNLTLE